MVGGTNALTIATTQAMAILPVTINIPKDTQNSNYQECWVKEGWHIVDISIAHACNRCPERRVGRRPTKRGLALRCLHRDVGGLHRVTSDEIEGCIPIIQRSVVQATRPPVAYCIRATAIVNTSKTYAMIAKTRSGTLKGRIFRAFDKAVSQAWQEVFYMLRYLPS